MFRRSKVIAQGSPPATPRVSSIGLPSFGGRGYESDSMTKATSSLRRPYAGVKQTTATTSLRRTATSKIGEVFTLPENCFSSQRSSSLMRGIPITGRTRTNSISSVSSQSASTSWGDSFLAKLTVADAPWASSHSPSSRGGSSASESKARLGELPPSSKVNWDGARSRKSSFTATPQSALKSVSGSARSKLKDVNVTAVPMKQDPPSAVHWQLIPYSLRERLGHPPLHFNLAADIDDNKDNICFANAYPRRPLTSKELGKTACDVEQMVVCCDGLPKWAKWLVVVNCGKDNIIRCGDVFKQIHKAFHQPMTAGELACIPASEKKACDKAFEKRCESNAGLTAWNKKQGMKRVDYLRNKTFFNGLTFDKDRSIWVLHLTTSRLS